MPTLPLPYRSLIALAAAAVITLTGTASQAAGDATAGKTMFVRCAACHTVEKDAPNKVGPNLYGIIGRKSASNEGFKYSDAMKKADLTWDEDSLQKYLADPRGMIPGNRMAFIGLKNQDDRDNIIAYLKQVSGP